MFKYHIGRRSAWLPSIAILTLVAAAAVIVPGSIASSGTAPGPGPLYLSVDEGNAQTGDVTFGSMSQPLSSSQGCNLTSDESLLTFDGGSKTVGIKSGGIGIRSKGPGESCAEIQGSELLGVSLSSALDGLAIGDARLDVEVKGDVIVVVTTSLLGLPGDVFTLRTGANTTDPNADAFALSTTASPNAECNGGADSRPDSRDNCHWDLQPTVPFDSFTMETTGTGSISLEGGSESPEGGTAAPTLLNLVDAPDGVLDCGDSITEGNADITGVITRLDNSDGSTCNLKPYEYDLIEDSENGDSLLFVPDGGDLAAYSAQISAPLDDGNPLSIWLTYDQDGDGTTHSSEDMAWCSDSTMGTVGGVEVVASATVPTGHTWCVAVVEASEPDDSVTFFVYGMDDPGFRFR